MLSNWDKAENTFLPMKSVIWLFGSETRPSIDPTNTPNAGTPSRFYYEEICTYELDIEEYLNNRLDKTTQILLNLNNDKYSAC